MAKKNNTKKISSAKKKEILVSLANNQDKAKKDIAKSMGISERSLYYILKENHDEYYKIMQEIENLRHQKAFDKPEYYSRLKNEIKALCKTPEMTASSDLVAELDKKIRTAKRHYR